MPRTLIHADAWTGNAIAAPGGWVVLIDWECGGLGPAILDFGALILHAHYDRPDHAPDAARIGALLYGYRRHRALTPAELAVLTLPIGFAPAFRSVLFFFRAGQRGWDDGIARHLRREQGRFVASAALAQAALVHLRAPGATR